MKFLIIEQDLRVSGTSQGIISRSFLAKLRVSYPNAIIDVVYLKRNQSEDQLHLLPVDSIQTYVLNLKVPFFTRWLNKIYWRLFHVSLKERYVENVFKSYISKIDHNGYDHIFIRSAGLDHESILGARDLPILKKAIVNFHDPYPLFWYAGTDAKLSYLELFKLKKMEAVVLQAKACMSSARLMSQDMQYLYGSRKKFYHLPHQYDETVFDLSDKKNVFTKAKKITICYHGAIQFGRDVVKLLEAYKVLVLGNTQYKDTTEFILRLKKQADIDYLARRYAGIDNIKVLGPANFSNAAYEQIHLADINIILENGPLYCNILVGKAPFLASFNKPVLAISPERSEMRGIIKNDQYIANAHDDQDIKYKLEQLILDRLNTNASVYPFGDYFSDAHFKHLLDKVLMATKK
ncbi:hypothetical protein KO566_11745 [Flavobacteriaceae bacterium XHP0103]|uniref:hypothetical protein n=1 Tax=Marixanthotalea marina TaxID=2844359 RepID=UPI002989BE18|nr:hypothetical protein [Marixanthotalea marina]MBU3822738.1 hypothetical protein [Marixanthotalea marina]